MASDANGEHLFWSTLYI